jgi:hypothetical protein
MCAKFGTPFYLRVFTYYTRPTKTALILGKCHTEVELKLYNFAFSKALLILHYCLRRDAGPTQAGKHSIR